MKETSRTGISILTPSYGYAQFIEDAIHSVIKQKGPTQHIVADGGSPDGTVAILRRHPHVTWISRSDSGQSEALNRAFPMAVESVVGWLNADEYYLPGAFGIVRAVLAQVDADVVFGDSIFVDRDGRMLRLLPQHCVSRSILRHWGPGISSCASFFSRSALERVGREPWDQESRRLMDWDLFLRLLARGMRFHYVPVPLGAFRVHVDRVTATDGEKNSPEVSRIRRRHGLPQEGLHRELRSGAARLEHVGRKLASGAYGRQLRSIRFRGVDTRWWRDERVHEDTAALVEDLAARHGRNRLHSSS